MECASSALNLIRILLSRVIMIEHKSWYNSAKVSGAASASASPESCPATDEDPNRGFRLPALHRLCVPTILPVWPPCGLPLPTLTLTQMVRFFFDGTGQHLEFFFGVEQRSRNIRHSAPQFDQGQDAPGHDQVKRERT